MIPGPIQVIAVVNEIIAVQGKKYSLKLYSEGSVIPGEDTGIKNFGLFEDGYVFLFSGGITGINYFEVWVKFTPMSKSL